MTPEQPLQQRKPYEIFGLTDDEATRLRVTDERLKEIPTNPNTITHTLKLSTNAFGEFLFLTTSRGIKPQRICMTFFGFGFHEFRERWISDEWFWNQSQESFVYIQSKLSIEELTEKLVQRLNDISSKFGEDPQTEFGRMFEQIADLIDDDAALAEMQGLGLL